MDWVKRRLLDRVRQFGYHAALTQILRALVRNVYRIDRHIVFVISEFSGSDYHDSCIKPLPGERIEQAARAGELSPTDVQLLTEFLDEGCQGICAEIDGKIAGYAWVQYSGKYRFGRNGTMTIPPKYAVFKNLLVFPEFRGQRLGQKLDAAGLALIPASHTPVTFIIPENRYAIRNSEKCEFKRVLEIKQSRWLRGRWRTSMEKLSECAEADALFEALELANRK